MLVGEDERRPLGLRLGKQQMIEQLAMMRRAKLRRNKPFRLRAGTDRGDIGGKLPNPRLDDDLPQRDHADEDIVGGIGGQRARFFPQRQIGSNLIPAWRVAAERLLEYGWAC